MFGDLILGKARKPLQNIPNNIPRQKKMRTVPGQESLTIEFKSDRNRLLDRELTGAVVCLANTDGGTLYLGVEDDGKITGLHPDRTSPEALAAMIINRTSPPVNVRVAIIEEEGMRVAVIEVPRCSNLVATSEGLIQRRRLLADGSPECVPFYPHEFLSRQADLGVLDYSSLPVANTSIADFDPVERARLRQMVDIYRGDRTLLSLSDDELDGALGLSRRDGGQVVPTVAGLLVLGRESVLRDLAPTHEVAFQVLDERRQVRVNDFYRMPLLKTFERVMEQFKARVEEDEAQVGMFRVPIPSFDERAFREAFVNALVHRDYTRVGPVYARRESDAFIISNPGGFVEGVTLNNLLVVEPRPRNPLLADVIKRIGLSERTGRGVDLIYEGLLRYGRPAPDYSRSDRTSVVVRFSSAEPDVQFLRLIMDEEKRTGSPISLDSLIVLSQLRQRNKLTIAEASVAIQKDEFAARAVLDRLIERGFVQTRGVRKSRVYSLSSNIPRLPHPSQDTSHVEEPILDPIRQEQVIMEYVLKNRDITRKQVIDLCGINDDQASRLLRRLQSKGKLIMRGRGRGTFYLAASRKFR